MSSERKGVSIRVGMARVGKRVVKLSIQVTMGLTALIALVLLFWLLIEDAEASSVIHDVVELLLEANVLDSLH